MSLVELLVVVAIIAILLGMLLPGLREARERGRRSACLGTLGGIGKAVSLYLGDNEELPADHGYYLFKQLRTGHYLDSRQVFRCPSAPETPTISYAHIDTPPASLEDLSAACALVRDRNQNHGRGYRYGQALRGDLGVSGFSAAGGIGTPWWRHCPPVPGAGWCTCDHRVPDEL